MFRLRAAVPEAAIHEDRDPFLSKDKVRLAEELLIPPPAGDSSRAKQRDQAQLGVLVPLSPNRRHDGAAFLGSEDIRHPKVLHIARRSPVAAGIHPA